MRGLVSFLYRLARWCNTLEKLSSGNPKRIGKRFVNRFLGRKLAWRIYIK